MSNLVPLTPSIEQLSRIIGSVAAPAFLLGAVAAFISVLISRMNRVIERSQFLHGIADEDGTKAYLKADISRLKLWATLLNQSIFYSTVCAIVTGSLVIVAFVSAMLHLAHEYGVAILFVVALVFFVLSLINLACETRIALHDFDHHVEPIRSWKGLESRAAWKINLNFWSDGHDVDQTSAMAPLCFAFWRSRSCDRSRSLWLSILYASRNADRGGRFD